jgi:hypothetical protein
MRGEQWVCRREVDASRGRDELWRLCCQLGHESSRWAGERKLQLTFVLPVRVRQPFAQYRSIHGDGALAVVCTLVWRQNVYEIDPVTTHLDLAYGRDSGRDWRGIRADQSTYQLTMWKLFASTGWMIEQKRGMSLFVWVLGVEVKHVEYGSTCGPYSVSVHLTTYLLCSLSIRSLLSV